MKPSRTLSMGMAVHKDTMAVAYVANAHDAAVGTLGTRRCDRAQLLRKMPSNATQLIFVDEAGPCGYGRYR
jgi:transposase